LQRREKNIKGFYLLPVTYEVMKNPRAIWGRKPVCVTIKRNN
jgi:hypothetical protein